MTRIEVPQRPGAYRWWYVDASCGDFTVVAIFMIGSLFSPRYAVTGLRGAAPSAHAAVNFALYQRGTRRLWALSEYDGVEASADGLCIGASQLRYDGDGARLSIVERTAPWGTPFEASIELDADGPGVAPVELVPGLSHRWQPIAPRARARVNVLGLELDAAAYHDGNFGDVPLGTDLRGWEWERRCSGALTEIVYQPWGGEALHVEAGERGVAVRRGAAGEVRRSRTAWGLDVPRGSSVLESSPFYARWIGDAHVVGEVADFARFRSPWIRWMARLRTRMERAA